MARTRDIYHSIDASRRAGWAKAYEMENTAYELLSLIFEATDLIIYNNRVSAGAPELTAAWELRHRASAKLK